MSECDDALVLDILIAGQAEQALQPQAKAYFVEGKGIEGDRYFYKNGTFSERLEAAGDYQVTLIESEEIEAFNAATGKSYTAADFRRNVVTSGIRLNDLVGKRFRIGDVECYGVRLCEPCAHLAGQLGAEIMQHMLHKSGLRATITRSGHCTVNDRIEALSG